MIEFSLMLLLLGLVQIIFYFRNKKRVNKLSRNRDNLSGNRVNDGGFNRAGYALRALINDASRQIFGKKRELLFKNSMIITIAVFAAMYINENFLRINLLITIVLSLLSVLYVLYVKGKNNYRRLFERDFSEALNIITSSVRVGNTINQGINECANKIVGELGEEFKRINQRMDIGEDPELVFMESYQRFPYSEYFSFITAILINMKGGGQVSDVMSRLTSQISSSKILEKKKYAMTSEARMSVKVLAVIPVFFFFFMKYQSPDSFNVLLYHPIGQWILYYVIGSILLGLLVVWLMMNRVA